MSTTPETAPYMKTSARRPLFIDFDLHTDGDQDFKNELVTLMIDNVRELQRAYQALAKNGHESFLKAAHKMKSTIEIINDKDLSDIVAKFSDAEEVKKSGNAAVFNSLCDDIVNSLEQELHS
jgi:hypothetical protein